MAPLTFALLCIAIAAFNGWRQSRRPREDGMRCPNCGGPVAIDPIPRFRNADSRGEDIDGMAARTTHIAYCVGPIEDCDWCEPMTFEHDLEAMREETFVRRM